MSATSYKKWSYCKFFFFLFFLQLILKCIIDLYLNRKKIKAFCLSLQKDSTTPPLTCEEEDEPENLITVTTSQTRGVKRKSK